MRIQSNGSVGIGIDTTGASTVKLRVVSDVNANWACEIKNTNTLYLNGQGIPVCRVKLVVALLSCDLLR